ncbi:MAG: hypothetical protein CVV64_14395 [Candidatus Wallbacteria bacterium HGW-Wallbacteria-1]|jgi:hypothetical protein|uniref:Uncharacterized protein n=1 Tax=Candidatus Wallbacteria bacterium HGW-Wallbacteria-1 TaxID=2013854 RepID=A0A2N1PM42_9BACT|nr:MAG: hypothetical protein CVV64_14395 [Candidatus Wallbacteria bacterium HGW-Wallbacteria-1]
MKSIRRNEVNFADRLLDGLTVILPFLGVLCTMLVSYKAPLYIGEYSEFTNMLMMLIAVFPLVLLTQIGQFAGFLEGRGLNSSVAGFMASFILFMGPSIFLFMNWKLDFRKPRLINGGVTQKFVQGDSCKAEIVFGEGYTVLSEMSRHQFDSLNSGAKAVLTVGRGVLLPWIGPVQVLDRNGVPVSVDVDHGIGETD